MAALAQNCKIFHGVGGVFSCAETKAFLVVDVVVTLRDLFVTLEAFVLLLFQEALQGGVGKLFSFGRQQCLEELCVDHAAALAIVGHLNASGLFEYFRDAKVHVGFALDLCLLRQEQAKSVWNADNPNNGRPFLVVLALLLHVHMDVEGFDYFRWVCVLIVEGDPFFSKLLLHQLYAARLECLGLLLFDCLQHVAKLVPV